MKCFRVQYSDLAMLKWVQLQVLAADNSILIENIDNSTREEWDGEQKCPERSIMSNPSSSTSQQLQQQQQQQQQHGQEQQQGQNQNNNKLPIGDGSDSYAQEDMDMINKNLAPDNSPQQTSKDDNNNRTDGKDGTDGTDGYSTDLETVLDHATVTRMQDQTILSVLSKIQDYDISNSTLTLLNGTVVRMADMMDKPTVVRLVQTLEDSRLKISNSGGMSRVAPLNSKEMMNALHEDSSLIMIPPSDSEIEESTHGHFGLSNNGDHNNNGTGRGLVQEDNKNRILDKSSEGTSSRMVDLAATVVAMVFIASLLL
ncbi:hypothetical protein BGX28_004932 [Mortierella sp. GBA30]|nr:hypothetical protein BGX28_004932 [Mortierella sp. GBA30]